MKLGEDGQNWDAYMACLENGKSPASDSPVSSGYWRLVGGKGTYAVPVKTVFESSAITAKLGDADLIDRDAGEDWHRFATTHWPKLRAVEYDDWDTAVRTGFWPDGIATSTKDAPGGNNPPEDPNEKLLREARETVEKAKAMIAKGAAKSEKTADAGAVLIKALTSSKPLLEAAHKIEKEPHRTAGLAVDAKYNPLIKEMTALSIEMRKKVTAPFLNEKERIANEAAQREANERAERERLAQEAERKAAEADRDWDAAAPAEPAVPVVVEPVPVEPVKVSAGVTGGKVGLKTRYYGRVTDRAAFAAGLLALNYHELNSALDAIAHQVARKLELREGINPVAGMEVYTERY